MKLGITANEIDFGVQWARAAMGTVRTGDSFGRHQDCRRAGSGVLEGRLKDHTWLAFDRAAVVHH